MLLIPCPWCGARDETEFHYGGEAHMALPPNPDRFGDEAWGDFLFMRTNPKGWMRERWVHTQGCRRWFNLIRHTVTHEIAGAYKPDEAKPQLPE